jgi:hypothetical protein
MGFLKSLMIRIGADASGVDKELKRTSKQLISTGREWEKVGATMTKGLTLPILAVGAAAVKLGMDAVESENLFNVSMGKMADKAREWSKSMSEPLKLNDYSVRKYMGTMNAMLVSMGQSEGAAFDMSKGLTTLAYDMASFYNLDPQEAFDKLRSGIAGESEPLKALGILITDTAAKQKAYAMGIAAVGTELNDTQKVAARYALIMERTAMAQGDLARTIDSPANKLRAMKETLTKIVADFGVNLVNSGAFQSILESLEKIMKALGNLATRFAMLSPFWQDFIVNAALITAAAGPFVTAIGGMITWLGNLGLAAIGTKASLSLLFAEITLIAAAGTALGFGLDWVTDKIGMTGTEKYKPGTSTAKNGEFINGKWASALDGSKGPYKPGTGPYATNAAGMPNSWFPAAPKLPSSTSASDSVAKAIEDQNKALAEQAAILAKTENAAKAAAALDTFRSSVKSLAQAMMDAAKSFANWTGAFDKVERQQVSGARLATRMQGQATAMQDWVDAMGQLKGKVGTALYSELLNLGPGAVDQIRALVNDSDALSSYQSAWQTKNDLAAGMGNEAGSLNYKAQQVIESQVNTINVIGSGNVDAIAAAVVKKLRLAGAM